MTWDWLPWIVETIGLAIFIVWTILPIREFIGIYHRLIAERPSTAETPRAEEVAS